MVAAEVILEVGAMPGEEEGREKEKEEEKENGKEAKERESTRKIVCTWGWGRSGARGESRGTFDL